LFIRNFQHFQNFRHTICAREIGSVLSANLTWSDMMSMTCDGAICDELHGIDLGDQRLNKRSRRLIAALAVDPQLSINASCGGWDETHAAYQFFDNEKVTPARILRPHQVATLHRMRTHPVVLIAQDTTELDYTAHPARDAKCLNIVQRFGFYEHVQLAITPEGLPLGVVGTQSHDREPESLGHAHGRRTLAIEDKESHRWLQAYQDACDLQALCPDTQVVSIADREGDIYDLYVEYRDHVGPRAEFLIRAQQARSTMQPNPALGKKGYCKVLDEVRRSPLLKTLKIDLKATSKRAAREACLEIRALKITVKPPHARQHLQPVVVNVVLAEEVGGPGDGTDVSWQLITSLPIDTVDEVLLVVHYYQQRWAVEIYFKILKTGCNVEKLQLETTARLKNALALYEIIAWRIMSVTYLNRTAPDTPCDDVFTTDEWKSVWFVTKNTKPPITPPTLAEFVILLTRLGGYNNRPKERRPGPLPFWIGLRRMYDLALAYKTFGPDTETCV
jgi:hypothetical protein